MLRTGDEDYPDGQAAAVYGQTPPLVNASLPPAERRFVNAAPSGRSNAPKIPAWSTMAFQDVVAPLIFTFIVGNSTHLSAVVMAPVYRRRSFPWDVSLLLTILIPASIVGGYLASVVTKFVLQPGAENLFEFSSPDILKSIFFSLVIAVPVYLSRKSHTRLEMRTRELES